MKPQNAAERRQSFLRFLFFYIITTALIVSAVFFGIHVPFRQNKQLLAQLDVVQKESDFDRQFLKLMQETKAMLDTVNSAGPLTDVIDGRIGMKIQEMDAVLSRDSISGKRIYSSIIQYFSDAKNDKKMLRSTDKQQILADCQQQQAQLKSQLDDNKSKYEKLLAQYMTVIQSSR